MLTTLSLAASRPRLRILAGEAAVAGGTVPAPRNSMFAMAATPATALRRHLRISLPDDTNTKTAFDASDV